MTDTQLPLFPPADFSSDHAATWSPRDLWLKLDGTNLNKFKEDKRIERKGTKNVHFDTIAEYYSMWSNTVDGGVMLFGVENDGSISGCASLSAEKLNRLDNFHIQMCPEANPESKRIPVRVSGKPDFVVSVFIPYKGVLVETQRGHAYIRYGDSKHQMSPEEKEDFRSTRHERSWEQRESSYIFPSEFDLEIIEEYCRTFKTRERKQG